MMYIKDCTLCAVWEKVGHILGRGVDCLNVMNRNTPTLWVWSLPFHTLGKNPQATAWKDTAEG